MLRTLAKLNVTKAIISSAQRNITTSSRLFDIFKVQNEKDFEDRVLNAKNVVVIDFMATWCNPCKMLGPRIEQVIEENKGKVSLAKVSSQIDFINNPVIIKFLLLLLFFVLSWLKVDIDELTDLSLEYGIQAVPVLAIIKDGKIQSQLVGLQDIDKIRAWVKSNIGE